MPGLQFSGPNLATVAYADVDGVTGASPTLNSGVATTRGTTPGTYFVVLPTNLAQGDGSDLIFVQLKQSADGSGLVAKNAVVDDSGSITKVILVWSGNPALVAATQLDSSFSILILRSTISPPAGAPG